MNSQTLNPPLADAPHRPWGSLRWRCVLAVPLFAALGVLGFEWGLGGWAGVREGLARIAALVGVVSVAQWLLIEVLVLRPLHALAGACERVSTQPVPQVLPGEPAPWAQAAELSRIEHALRHMQGTVWQQQQEALLCQRELESQRVALAQAEAARAAQQRELADLSRTDTLTGLANQRAFDETLRREFKRAQRLRGLLALAVLDLDQFKQFNSAHGNAAGDTALQRVADLLSARLKRDTDVVARLGGEEFVALLPGFGMAEAQSVLESVREDLRALRLPDGSGGLTVSIGLAAASPAHPYLSAQALMQAADEALYIAKHAGRDRLSLAA